MSAAERGSLRDLREQLVAQHGVSADLLAALRLILHKSPDVPSWLTSGDMKVVEAAMRRAEGRAS